MHISIAFSFSICSSHQCVCVRKTYSVAVAAATWSWSLLLFFLELSEVLQVQQLPCVYYVQLSYIHTMGDAHFGRSSIRSVCTYKMWINKSIRMERKSTNFFIFIIIINIIVISITTEWIFKKEKGWLVELWCEWCSSNTHYMNSQETAKFQFKCSGGIKWCNHSAKSSLILSCYFPHTYCNLEIALCYHQFTIHFGLDENML